VEIVTQILKTIPMVMFALFLGPWSDKAGRKMLIILPFLGYFLYCITFIVNNYFFDELVVEFLWFESISSYFGGFALLFLGAYGYIADTTSLKSRTIRIAVMDGMMSVAATIGGFINGYLYAELGYYGSFGCASACFLLGLVIVFFTVKNQRDTNKKNTKTSVLDMKNVLESFKVLSKPRPESMRHIVIILVACFQIGRFAYHGASYVDYLYVRRKFVWNDENNLVRINLYQHLVSVGENIE
jgi:MFS family permease